MAPIVNNLAGKVASTIMLGSEGGTANLVSNVDGGGNIISPTSETFLQANAVLDDNSADQMTRYCVNDPTTDARTTSSLQGLLNPVSTISEQFRTGQMKSGLGYEKWFRDQTVIKHTTGSFTAGTVNGADQTGTSITVNAITGQLNVGDIITFEGVNGVNRVTKQDQGTLRQFVITAIALNGATTISIYPALIPQGAGGSDVQYQTVMTSPANGADVILATPAGSVYRKSLAYVRNAVTMATADLVLPRKAVEEAGRAEYDGVSMRVLTDYLPGSDQLATRVDVLFGYLYVRPEWICTVADCV